MSANTTEHVETVVENPTEMMPVSVESVHPADVRDTKYRDSRRDRAHLYTVITTNEQFYVGMTEREPEERWKEHRGHGKYSGAEFLQDKEIASFVLVGRNIKNAEEIEDKVTLQLMAKYGVENCSGGEYAKDESPTKDAKKLIGNPPEFDYLSDVEQLEAEPIPEPDAHPSVKNSAVDNMIAMVVVPVYLVVGLLMFLIGAGIILVVFSIIWEIITFLIGVVF